MAFKLGLFGVPGMSFGAAKLLGWIYTLVVIAATVWVSRRAMNREEKALAWLALLILATLRSPFLPGYAVFPPLWLLTLLAATAGPTPKTLGLLLLGWAALNMLASQASGLDPKVISTLTLLPQTATLVVTVLALRRLAHTAPSTWLTRPNLAQPDPTRPNLTQPEPNGERVLPFGAMRTDALPILQRCWLVTTACALLGVAGHAQPPPVSAPQSGAIFRASVQLVQVDVAVSDAQGVAVPTLGPSDFVLRQDGKPVAVQFATFVTGAVRQTRFVFFIDDYHLEFDNFVRVREAVSRFMEHAAPAGAEMLVMPASFVGEKTFAFTTSPTVVRRQVADLSWGKGDMRGAGRRGMATCENLTNDLRADMFTAGTMGTLSALLAALHQIEGRKAVILLTDGLISACRTEFDAPERLRRISEIANRGSSVLYGVDTRSFTSGGSNMLDDDLQYLAERTGGISGRSNAIEKILARVAADQEGYYLLAYEPPPTTFKKGRLQYRDVKVTVTRPDLQVRARAGFYNVPDGALKLQ